MKEQQVQTLIDPPSWLVARDFILLSIWAASQLIRRPSDHPSIHPSIHLYIYTLLSVLTYCWAFSLNREEIFPSLTLGWRRVNHVHSFHSISPARDLPILANRIRQNSLRRHRQLGGEIKRVNEIWDVSYDFTIASVYGKNFFNGFVLYVATVVVFFGKSGKICISLSKWVFRLTCCHELFCVIYLWASQSNFD